MCKENRTIIDNPQFRDSSSKLIFGDNILSCQFFRDYADMEILRNIQPEDIEDVSERYVPLYSTERESDTVKKVNISKYLSVDKDDNTLDLPLYIVSLVEHKTKVEYNVAMQMLRYMVHIWEDYEKEMEKEHSGISNMKDFRYPPILPIVYYEGKRMWTAPMNLSDRILCKDLLGKYLPHFQYQLVRLHDYSNDELLKKGDEISLTMLINKIVSLEDIEAFANLPDEQVNEILKDTPEYLLQIMEKLARALFYSLCMPEDKTEEAVAKIKERKMGRLFENVTFNYQAEMESMRNKKREMEKEIQEMEEQKEKEIQEMEEQKEKEIREMEEQKEKEIQEMAEQKEKEIQEMAKQKEKEIREVEEQKEKEMREVKEQKEKEIQEMREEAEEKNKQLEKQNEIMKQEREIFLQISKMSVRKCSKTEIENFLVKNFSITKEEAREEIRKVYED